MMNLSDQWVGSIPEIKSLKTHDHEVVMEIH